MNSYRFLLTLALAILNIATGLAQYDVLPVTGRNELFHDYLIRDLDSLTEKRNEAVAAALASGETVLARQVELRSRYLELLGNFPDKTPLNAEVVGMIDTLDGYRIEKIHYQSVPDHHVTANFYIPDTGTGPYPTVIFLCGHYNVAKTNVDYQDLSILFARHGIACLIVDPICQYERYQITNESGALSFVGESGTKQHSRLDQGLVDCGTSVVAYELWDNHRGVDYLYSRTDVVDTAKIGCLGHSGGGAQATYLLAFDQRLKVGTVANFLANETAMFTITGPQTASQNLSYEGENGIDEPDYVEMFAPKPYMIIGTDDGLFPLAATRETYAEAQGFYDKLGAPEALSLFETADGNHNYITVKREATVRWFRKWFYGINDTIIEGEQTTFPSDSLYVTDTKNVMTFFDNERNVTAMNVELAYGYTSNRAAFWTDNTKDSCLNWIRHLIRYKELNEAPVYEATETIQRDGYSIEKGQINYGYHVPVTSLIFREDNISGKVPAVLYVDGRGKKQDAGEGKIVEKVYVDSGYVVMSIDVRGFGETSDNTSKNETKHNNKEHRNAVISLYEGKTLPGQRVQDIEKAMEVLCSLDNVDTSDITIVGIDRASVAVLHAAALDTRFKKTVIRLASETPWLDVVADPTIKDQMTHEIPGALIYYDITSLIENGIAPRSALFAGEPVITGINENHTETGRVQIYPNPFSNRALISYNLEKPGNITLMIYGLDGKLVRTVNQPAQSPGSHQIELKALDFKPGIYIYNLFTDNVQVQSQKMIVTR